MSIESQIAAFTAQAGLLLDLPQQIQTTAATKINEITAAYTGRLNSLYINVFVHETLGLDTNPGTDALPFKTIAKAISVVPIGAIGFINLKSDYTQAERVTVSGKYITIRSADATRKAINFNRLLTLFGATQYRTIAGFNVEGNAGINFSNVRINVPALDGTWPSYPPLADSLITILNTATAGSLFVGFGYIDFDIPATQFGQLVLGAWPVNIFVGPTTFVGASTSLQGKIVMGYTNTAGTAPPPWVTVNMSTI